MVLGEVSSCDQPLLQTAPENKGTKTKMAERRLLPQNGLSLSRAIQYKETGLAKSCLKVIFLELSR